MTISEMKELVFSDQEIDFGQALSLCSEENAPLDDLIDAAHEIRKRFHDQSLELCSIINVRSGSCSENCAFCAQSSHHEADSPEHGFLAPEAIHEAALKMHKAGAGRFSIVTSGKNMRESEFNKLLDAVGAVRRAGVVADVSPGILTPNQFASLKCAGAGAYHHNLETGREFFPTICTTHDYDEDVQTIEDAKHAGLYVCSGGLFGLGESWKDRIELAFELRRLSVDSVPLNFLHPIPGTPMESRPLLSPEEALRITALFRFILPKAQIRICGGRHDVFGPDDQKRLLLSGPSGIMVGDYLTISGGSVQDDLNCALNAGLSIPRIDNPNQSN